MTLLANPARAALLTAKQTANLSNSNIVESPLASGMSTNPRTSAQPSVAETILKTVDRKVRGFESHPLRQYEAGRR